ncbi:phosphoserine phosphatase [Anaerolineales bacterium]|nr:phosphoserine phosphatase [Anaerolineales bacterium]
MTELWLIRHGQTDWNLLGKWQGQSPDAPGLNDFGITQARSVLDQLPCTKFSAIYSSDLSRAIQTAELISESLNLTVTIDPRLREINLGAWEGMLSNDIKVRYPRELWERERNPFDAHAPQGESPRDVAQRVITAVNEIAHRHPGESVIIVSHGVALAVIICHAQGMSMDKVYENIPDNVTPGCVKWG